LRTLVQKVFSNGRRRIRYLCPSVTSAVERLGQISFKRKGNQEGIASVIGRPVWTKYSVNYS